jgi:hypothetical protein
MITAESLYWLELFQIWKTFGGIDLLMLDAKSAEAIAFLEAHYRGGEHHEEITGQHQRTA